MTRPPLSTAAADHNVFAGNPLDRAANERKDAAWLQAQYDDPARRILPIWRLRFPVAEGAAGGVGAELIWMPPPAIAALPSDPMPDPVLLGLRDGVPHFAQDLSALDVAALDDPGGGPRSHAGRVLPRPAQRRGQPAPGRLGPRRAGAVAGRLARAARLLPGLRRGHRVAPRAARTASAPAATPSTFRAPTPS